MFSQMSRFTSLLSKPYGEEPTPTPPTPPKEEKPAGKLFTQDEVNAMLAENKRGLQKQVEDLKKQSGDASAFQAKIKELSDSLLTKDELAKQEADRLKAEHENALKTAVETGAKWEQQYKSQLFDVAMGKAAATHDLFDPDQFAAILKPMTEIVPETDANGNAKGTFKVMVKVQFNDKEISLPLVEAVGKLRETGKYPNQFKVKGVGGTGVTTLNNQPGPSVGPGQVKPGDMDSFMKAYAGMKATGAIR